MFDHDNFINKSCQGIFGRDVEYIPGSSENPPFQMRGDFHEAYIEVNLQTTKEADISTAEIVLFVRLVDFPLEYKNPLQGDFLIINEKKYQIVDIQAHIPGSKKLILHED